MRSLKILTLLVFTVNLNSAFAGNIYCYYADEGVLVPYGSEEQPASVMAGPNISVYKTNCDGIVCTLVFKSFGYEDAVYEFNKAQALTHTVDGQTVTCEDTAVTQTRDDLREFEDDARDALREFEDDAQGVGRRIERGLKSLF